MVDKGRPQKRLVERAILVELGRLTGRSAADVLKAAEKSGLRLDWPGESTVRRWWRGADLPRGRARRGQERDKKLRLHIVRVAMPVRRRRKCYSEMLMLFEPGSGRIGFRLRGTFKPPGEEERFQRIEHDAASFIQSLPKAVAAGFTELLFTSPASEAPIAELCAPTPGWYTAAAALPPTMHVRGSAMAVRRDIPSKDYRSIDLTGLGTSQVAGRLRALVKAHNRGRPPPPPAIRSIPRPRNSRRGLESEAGGSG